MTMAVDLPDSVAAFVDEKVRTGRYQNSASVIVRALRVLEAVERRQSRFHAAIQEGVDDLDAGNYEEVHDLDAWFAELRSRRV